MVAAKPADVAFHSALLVGALLTRLAVERLDPVVGAESRPACGLHPGTGEPQNLSDGGLEVVVADLAEWHPSQHAEGVDVSLEERFLAAGGEHAVHGLARIRQPQREQHALDHLVGQSDGHLPEVDLGLGAGPVRLGHERLTRAPARLGPDLGTALRDVGANHLIRHSHRVMLAHQPVEDALGGVTLLARRVQVRAQHLIDHVLVGVDLGRSLWQLLAWFRPCRGQRLLHRAEPDAVLRLQCPVGHASASIAADRRVQLNLRHARHVGSLTVRSTLIVPPQPLGCCQNSATQSGGLHDRCHGRPTNAVATQV